jgi:hypothetical protein
MAIPEARQQSFEELYGPPENLLEIEVSSRAKRKLVVCRRPGSFLETKG